MAKTPLGMRIRLRGFILTRKKSAKDRDWKTFSMLRIFKRRKLTSENFGVEKAKQENCFAGFSSVKNLGWIVQDFCGGKR
jgi:hypothetical protein